MRNLLVSAILIAIFLWAGNTRAELAINLHGYSKHFGEHPDLVNSKHDLIGVEYCDANFCGSYAHFRDAYNYKNNAYGLHSRYALTDYITLGAMGAYVTRYKPRMGLAPELILHIEGAGVRIMCLPAYEERPPHCTINTRIAF